MDKEASELSCLEKCTWKRQKKQKAGRRKSKKNRSPDEETWTGRKERGKVDETRNVACWKKDEEKGTEGRGRN